MSAPAIGRLPRFAALLFLPYSEQVFPSCLGDCKTVFDEMRVGQILGRLIEPYKLRREKHCTLGSSFGRELAAVSTSNTHLPQHNGSVAPLSTPLNICLGGFKEINLFSHQALVGR
jgi:hypothetical protein